MKYVFFLKKKKQKNILESSFHFPMMTEGSEYLPSLIREMKKEKKMEDGMLKGRVQEMAKRRQWTMSM